MIEPDNFLKRLARLADRGAPPLPTQTPFGFTTRVLARLRDVEPENPLARLAVRAVPVGAAVAVLSLLLALHQPAGASEAEPSGLAQQIVLNALEQ